MTNKTSHFGGRLTTIIGNKTNHMQPIGKYIVVKDVQETVTTESGLILSGEDTNQLRYKRAVVVASGTDVTVINEDDELYYDKAHSFTMLIDDVQYTIISERDVVVVI